MTDKTQEAAEKEVADLGDSSSPKDQADEAEAGVEKPEEGKPEKDNSEGEEEEKKEEAKSGSDKEDGSEEHLPPVPYKRFAKAIADKNDALDKVSQLEEKISEFNKYVESTKDIVDFARRLFLAKSFDPRIRELYQDHWLFNGREPQVSDIEDPKAYGEYLREIDDYGEAESETSEEVSDESKDALIGRWMSEEKSLLSDAELRPIVTKERLIETYRNIMERIDSGEDVSRLSFAKVFRDLWFDDIVEAKKEAARKEATSKVTKRKPASLRPGLSGQPKQRDLSKLPLHEHIAAVVRGEAVT